MSLVYWVPYILFFSKTNKINYLVVVFVVPIGFYTWVGKIPERRKWQSIPVLLSGKSHGRRSLVGYSPWGCRESDMTKWIQFRKQSWTRAHTLHIHEKQQNSIQKYVPFSKWKSTLYQSICQYPKSTNHHAHATICEVESRAIFPSQQGYSALLP